MVNNTMVAYQMFSLYNMFQDKDPVLMEKAFAEIKGMGYNAVQMPWNFIPAEELRRLLDKYDLFLCSVHADPDGLIQDPKPLINFVKQSGGKYIGVGGMPQRLPHSPENARTFIKEMAPAIQQIKDAGIKFTYHNHSWELARTDGITELEVMMQESDLDAFWFEVDTYWIQYGGGDPAEWIRKMKGRIGTIHCKDMIYSPSRQAPYFAEVGEGNLNWLSIIKAGGEVGAEWYIVEQDASDRPEPLDSARMSLKNLHKMGLR